MNLYFNTYKYKFSNTLLYENNKNLYMDLHFNNLVYQSYTNEKTLLQLQNHI